MLVDSHSHISFPQLFPQINSIVTKAKELGFFAIIDVGIDKNTSLKSVEVSSNYDLVYSAIGFHPHCSGDFDQEVLVVYKDLLSKDLPIIAIGEIGLDIKSNNR